MRFHHTYLSVEDRNRSGNLKFGSREIGVDSVGYFVVGIDFYETLISARNRARRARGDRPSIEIEFWRTSPCELLNIVTSGDVGP